MENVQLNPLDPTLGEMMKNAVDAGTRVGACPPCLNVRGIGEGDLMDYVEVVGSGFIHEAIKEGAAVLNF